MPRKIKILLIVGGILAVLGLFVAAVLPAIVKNKAVEALRDATGRTVRIEKISLNPLTLTASVRGFAIEERGGGPFLGIGFIRVSVSPASLYRRALVLSRVEIDSPSLSLVRTGEDRFNFTDIAERQKKEEKPPSQGLFPFILNNFSLTNGSLDFHDQAIPGGGRHTLRNLAIAIPSLGSLPDLAEEPVTPKISAVINGAPFALTGRLKPFARSPEGSFHVALGELGLPVFAAYAPQPPPVELTSGRLTLDADLNYRRPADRKPELTASGLARIDALHLDLAGGEPLLRLPSLEIRAKSMELLAGVFDIASITLAGPEVFVSRDRQGRWMYERLLAPAAGKPTAQAEPGPAGGTPAPLFAVGSVTLKEGRVHFKDALPPGGFTTTAAGIDLALKDVTNRPGQAAQYGLSLLLDREVRLASSGSFAVTPPAANAAVTLSGLNIQKGWPYLAGYLTAPLKGLLDLSGEIAYDKESGLTAQNGSLTLKNLSARYGEGEGLEMARLSVNGAGFSQQANRLEIGEIRLSKGAVSLSRGADGTISAQTLLVTQPEKPVQSAPSSPGAATPAEQGGAKPLAYLVKRLELDHIDLAFTDHSRPGDPRFTLRETTLSLTGLSGPAPRPARVRFASIFGRETPLKAGGEITPLPFRYKGELSVSRLPIRDFEAYFPEDLNVQVIGGLLDASLALDITLRDGAAGSFRGSAGISSFHTVDSVAEEDLLKWERLQLDGIEGGLKPFRLAVGEIALNRPYARIIVRKDGTLNLQHLTKEAETGAAAEPGAGHGPVTDAAPAATPDPSSPPPQAEARAISIGAVTILDGTIPFTDNHLFEEFETTFYNLGGRISGLSSESSLLADVDLRGNLENHSPLTITGKINPLRDDLFVDLKVSFTDIDLSPLTPYAGTYLGYTVEKGKLFLDLKYHIEKKNLLSENKIMIDQFTFGKRVESDEATSLPVKLGLALLKDRRGEIHLDVPVTGRTDDPQFSIWRVIFQVLKNLLVKAVTSPFSLLSSLFGGGADLSVIPFAPGSAVLTGPEEQKLTALAKGLDDRPALKMTLTAYVDKIKDAEGYRIELLNRKVRKEKFLTLARGRQIGAGESAETTPLTPEEYSTYLKAVYAKEKFPKPRNALGIVLALPDAEMRKLILANTTIGSDELQDLARERVAAVMDFLVNKGGVPAERLFPKSDDLFKPPAKEGTAPSRVELNPIAP
ncbi:MAG: DUF748 domain-containing protein [Syntrophales bacterium]